MRKHWELLEGISIENITTGSIDLKLLFWHFDEKVNKRSKVLSGLLNLIHLSR